MLIFQAILGIALFAALAWLVSHDRARVRWSVVGVAFGAQVVLALVLTGLLLIGMNSDAGGLGLLTVAPLSLTHLFGALALGGLLFLRIRRVDARKAADARARTAAVFDLEG